MTKPMTFRIMSLAWLPAPEGVPFDEGSMVASKQGGAGGKAKPGKGTLC